MKPPKEIVEKAKTDGALNDADVLTSAAYLLSQVAAGYYRNAGDILSRYGLLMGEHKRLFNLLMKANGDYSSHYCRYLMVTDEHRAAHARNMERYRVRIAQMLGMGELLERITLEKMTLTEEEKKQYLLPDEPGDKVRVSFTTDEVTLSALDAIARREGRSRRELINMVLRHAIIIYQQESAIKDLQGR